MSLRIPFFGGLPKGNAGKSPTTNKNKNKKNQKRPPKWW